MAILYVASEASELKRFAEMLTGLRKLKWPIDYAYEGIWEGRRMLLAANGAGPKLAAQALEVAIRAGLMAELSSSRLEAVVSAGYCGAIDPELRELQIIVATQIIDQTNNESFECAPVTADTQFVSGPVLSQNEIAHDATAKEQLRASGAIAVDMEAAGVAARAKRAGLPFACIKVVSDAALESLPINFNEMRTTEGRLARGKIVMHALTRPNVIPALVRLKKRAEEGAKVLGEFIVSCRINTEQKSGAAESAGS
jgi:adenosylhomocysteine nucleosidase